MWVHDARTNAEDALADGHRALRTAPKATSENLTRRELKASDLGFATLAAVVWVAVIRPGPLDLPFFWDEADVYVPGARWVAEHGLSFSPASFSDDYSRGHPPLLYLLGGIAFSAFGTAPWVGHLVVLPFTVAALVATYLLGVRLWNRRVGVAAALLLGSTPLFLSVGNMLLPEMPLTAAAALGFLAIAHGRVGWAAAAGVFGVLVKETGLAAAGAVVVVILFDAWQRGALRERDTWARGSIAAIPFLTLGAFFAWQKATAGYFVFPHHANLLAARPFELSGLFTIFPSLFFWHGRWVVTAATLLATWLGWPVIAGTMTESPGTHTERWTPTRGAIFFGFAMLVLVNALFFAKMFWLERYVLPVHPVFALVGAFVVVVGMAHQPVLAALPSAVVIAFGLGRLWSPTGADQEELTFAYAHVIATHSEAFDAIDGDAPTVLTTWPMTVELEDPALGYVAEPVPATHIRYLSRDDEDPPFTHVLVNESSPHADDLRAEADAREMTRLGTFRVGHAPTLELYGR